MTKQELVSRVESIQEMGSLELDDFLAKVELSLLEPKAKYYLFRAIEIRKLELNPELAFVEGGELRASEFKL